MGDPALSLKLDRGDCRLGEELRGEVILQRDLEGSLEVAIGYGGRRVDRWEAGRVEVGSGAFAAGARLPFSIPLPVDAPHSFDGAGHSIVWWVRAEADVPWAFDPEVYAELVAEPGRVDAREEFERLSAALPKSKQHRQKLWPKLLYGLATLPVVVLGALFIPHMLICAAFLLPFGLLIWALGMAARTRVRNLKVELPERIALLGEWLPVTVSFELRHPIEVEEVEVTLKGVETWQTSTGSGKNRRTQTHKVTFAEDSLQFVGHGILAPQAPGARFEGQALLRLDEGGYPPIGDKVSWSVSAHVAIVGWPDPSVGEELQVASVILDGEQPPAPPPFAETSTDVLVVPEGAPVPFEVDASKLRERLWRWLIAPAVGVLSLIGGGLVSKNPDLVFATLNLGGNQVPIPHAGSMQALGSVLLVGGLLALLYKITR